MIILADYQFSIVGCILLFFAMISYWLCLSFPKKEKLLIFAKALVLTSNVLFALTLFLRWIREGYFPLSNLYESLIFLSWGISTFQLIMELKIKSRLIGSISTPLAFSISGFSTLTLPLEMQKALPLVPSLQSNWLMMHVSMMMISYAALIIGSLLSILYLAFNGLETINKVPNILELLKINIETNIKRKYEQSTLLQTIDQLSYRVIGLGFPFLTIGIISGAIWANEAWGTFWSWDPKETWALITWLIFATYLHARLLKGWQGEKAATIGSCGFFVIWICYLGVNFLGKGLHNYGWILS